MHLSCPCLVWICHGGKAFLRQYCSFWKLSQQQRCPQKRSISPRLSICRLPHGELCGEAHKVNSWLAWSTKTQAELNIASFSYFPQWHWETMGFFLVCLLLKLIHVHYYPYFVSERTSRDGVRMMALHQHCGRAKIKINQMRNAQVFRQCCILCGWIGIQGERLQSCRGWSPSPGSACPPSCEHSVGTAFGTCPAPSSFHAWEPRGLPRSGAHPETWEASTHSQAPWGLLHDDILSCPNIAKQERCEISHLLSFSKRKSGFFQEIWRKHQCRWGRLYQNCVYLLQKMSWNCRRHTWT